MKSRMTCTILLALLCSGCELLSDTSLHYTLNDRDGDGWVDCNVAPADTACDHVDTDASVFPMPDLCDGIDNDGDGSMDEDAALLLWLPDNDFDGYVDADASPTPSCDAPGLNYAQESQTEQDCDDRSGEVYPHAPELCDALDNDCDGDIDEGLDYIPWYTDQDGDGYGAIGSEEMRCSPPTDDPSLTMEGGDCNDEQPDVAPNKMEICDSIDNDCDGDVDEGLPTFYVNPDADSDGYAPTPTDAASGTLVCEVPVGYSTQTGDCNDTNPAIHPGAEEQCGALDNNCDGVSDLQPSDKDGDGFFTCSSTGAAVDCNDTQFTINPSALEVCDGLDNNCNAISDDVGPLVWYLDLDQDKYGDIETACITVAGDLDGEPELDYEACPELITPSAPAEAPPVSQCEWPEHSHLGGDCDDASSATSPVMPEVCNGKDDNCNAKIDEGLVSIDWFPDRDNDGYGDQDGKVQSCKRPISNGYRYVEKSGDCDDEDKASYPGATERIGDGGDQDCDGYELCFMDADIDQFPREDAPTSSEDWTCTGVGLFPSRNPPPETFDCDDEESKIFPTASETCNAIDDDCDEAIDEEIFQFWYSDSDGDGHGTGAGIQKSGCEIPGFSLQGDDCDDTSAARHPGNDEECDGIDNDCDDVIDEGVKITYYLDRDDDGYGDTAKPSMACEAPPDYVKDPGDCDDTDPEVNPGALEACDGIDNNCKQGIDEGFDVDGDHFTTCAKPTADCQDTNPAIHPNATEVCDGVDNNCDGVIDTDAIDRSTFYLDADGDGFGDPSSPVLACDPLVGTVENAADCDDLLASVNPDAEEVPDDGLDNDCDGTPDWDLRVCPGTNDPADYAIIQDALDDAALNQAPDALLIAVCPGTYSELLILPARALRLLGTHGPELTLVTPPAQQNGSTVLFESGGDASTLLEGFTLEAGTGNLGSTCGHSPTDRHGGSVCIQDSSPTLKRLLITPRAGQDQFPAYGGGIYVRQTSSHTAAPRLEQVTLLGNQATVQGGGLYALSATLTLEQVWVSGNTATDKGGGLALLSATTTAKWLRIDLNTAGSVGGGLYQSMGSFTVEQLRMDKNEAKTSGGAIHVQDGTAGEPSTLTVIHALLEANRTANGGGIYVNGHATLRLTHGVVRGHTQNSSGGLLSIGGGLYITGGNVKATLEQCVVAGNEAKNAGGGQGGGIYFNNSGNPLVLLRTVLAYNADTAGGSNLFVASGSTVSSTDGCFYGAGGFPGVKGVSLPSNLCSSEGPGWLNAPDDQGDISDDDYHLALGSPLIDVAGTSAFDPDGSDLDVGLYGGPLASVRDLDGDSIPEWYWTVAFSLPPEGVVAAEYECFDLVAERSGCAAERGSGVYDQPE